MVTITDKSQCCGCWACENICPKHCIRMEEDSEGFRYPVVDTDKCIDWYQYIRWFLFRYSKLCDRKKRSRVRGFV